MAQPYLGRKLVSVLFCLCGLVILVQPFYPWPAWQAPTMTIHTLVFSPGFVKVLCLLYGAALIAVSVLVWQGARLGLYASYGGLGSAIIAEVLLGKWLHCIFDVGILAYIHSLRDDFTG